MLLEALIAILIFSVGILALVAMQAQSIGYTAEAKYRSEAAFLANEILSRIWVDRAAIANYAFPGGTAADLAVWAAKVNTSLPGAAANPPTIVVNPPAGTVPATVTVTIFWQPPGADARRNYSSIAVITNP
jgi:type IV pilus assembly protein PilV